MKKIFLLLLLTATSVMLLANNGHNVKDEKEYVEIENEKEGIEEGRSLSYVECYIDRVYNVIEIGYAGIGIPSIVVFDTSNTPIHYTKGSSVSGTITIGLPSVEGLYSILIQSEVYSGEGTFCVD